MRHKTGEPCWCLARGGHRGLHMTAARSRRASRTRRRAGQQDSFAVHDAADQQALVDSATGNTEAFMPLAERHAQACLAVARQVLRDEEMAQDAVQEAYLELWRNASLFDPGRSLLGPWLVMLTHRRAVEKVRRGHQRPQPIELLPILVSESDLEEHTTTDLLGQQTVELLRELPGSQRDCLMLAYWGGYTMSEVSQLLDISVVTVMTRCRAALVRLGVLVRERGLDQHLRLPPHKTATA